MDGTKQYPPPGYTQVPTEPPPFCPYPAQAGCNAQYGDPSAEHLQQQQQQQQPMYPQLQQMQKPGSAYYAGAPAGQPVIVGQPQYVVGQPVVAVAVQPQAQPKQYIGTIVLAIFTSLCCGVFFGFIALMLAGKCIDATEGGAGRGGAARSWLLFTCQRTVTNLRT